MPRQKVEIHFKFIGISELVSLKGWVNMNLDIVIVYLIIALSGREWEEEKTFQPVPAGLWICYLAIYLWSE